jgi:hypothetical protein
LEIIYGKGSGEVSGITDNSLLKVDSQSVTLAFSRSLKNGSYLRLFQLNRQQTILETVVRKDIGERRRNDGPKTIIR